MAEQWIKLEHTTPDKPEVVAMASALKIDQDAVTGKLVRLWVWADQNSVDGACMRVTEAFIDRLVSKKGFAQALRREGWLAGDDGALTFTSFHRHNGTTAKGRAAENRRKADWRERDKIGTNVPPEPSLFSASCPENVPSNTGQNPPAKRGPDEDEEVRAKALTSAGSASPPVAREKLIEALAKAEGSDAAQLTTPHRGAIQKALSQILIACPGLTVEEIELRAKLYPRVMPSGAKLTAPALARYWAKCQGEKSPPPVTEPKNWRSRLQVVFPDNRVNRENLSWAHVMPETWKKVLDFEGKPGAKIA